MLARFVRVALSALVVVVLAACNSHSDVTGPSGDWVHVFIQNDSTVSFWSAGSLATGPAEIPPGGKGELFWVHPESYGGGVGVSRPAWNNLAIVNYMFAQPPASKAGFSIATIHVTANPSSPVTATCDRPDLLTITGVDQQ